jgi:hypothetical protein
MILIALAVAWAAHGVRAQSLEATLIPTDGLANDFHGLGGVRIDGDLAVTSAFRHDVGGVNATGAAWVWRLEGGEWKQKQKLTAPLPERTDLFGWDADICRCPEGEFIVLSGVFADKAWVFKYDGAQFLHEQTLQASDTGRGSNFGSSVSLASTPTGPILIVGAEAHDFEHTHDGIRAGAAFVFRRLANGTWDEQQELRQADRTENDQFAIRVDLTTATGVERALISSWLDDDRGNNSGAAYIFEFDGTNWVEKKKLIGSDVVADDVCGRWLAIDGDVAVVSAERHDLPGQENAGAVYVFRYNGTDWIEEQKLTASNGQAFDEFGGVVDIKGNTILVGADGASGTAGAVYIFEYDGSDWNETKILTSPNPEPSGGFAFGRLDGDRIIVGAPREDNTNGLNGGTVYVYSSGPPPDTDGDGLLDDWEENGFTAANGDFVNLPAMGADKDRKDIFVEIDYMAGQMPSQEALDLIVAAFAAAPVDNPDATTGITLHLTLGDEVPFEEFLGSESTEGVYDWQGSNPGTVYFEDLKAAHFTPSLPQVAHYCLFAHKLRFGDDTVSGMSRGSSGTEFAASEFVVSLGGVGVGGIGSVSQQAGTLMHELGHDLGLRHGGGDGINRKPNYLSVMNHSFQMSGLIGGGFDFSCCKLPDLDENSKLDETVGLNGGAAIAGLGTKWFCAPDDPRTTDNANGPINWNCNVDGQGEDIIDTALVKTDINADNLPAGFSSAPILTGFNDWEAIVFMGGAIGSTGATLPPPPPTTEPPQEVDEEIVAAVGPPAPEGLKGHPTDPQTTLTWNPVAAPGGGTVTYNVYRSAFGTVVFLGNTTNTNYHDRSKVDGVEYEYSVATVDTFGTEGPAVSVTVVSR